ncbi:alpha-tubulin suppressor-like RCC1 family protein [Paenibacillus sp. V4I9]|nr:alpha-tubulin suppressor-like RCC1 family protein [Paenibacillus sp. V4I9]
MNYISPKEAMLKVKRWPKDTIAAGRRHTVGLKSDGTVTAVGDNKYGQCDVSGWHDIVAVAAGNVHMAMNTGNAHTIGLKSDSTVAAVGWNEYGQCNVSDWRDIVAIAAGCAHTVGLKSDGTVVAAGDNEYDQCDVSGWCGIQLPGN